MASCNSQSEILPSVEDGGNMNVSSSSNEKQDGSPQKRFQPKSRFTVEFVRNDGVQFHLGEVNNALTPDHTPPGHSPSVSSDVMKHVDDAIPPPYHLADLYDRTYCYHKTLETLPNEEHYHVAEGNRFKQRRTLSELLAPIPNEDIQKETKDDATALGGEFPEEVKPISAAPKFGWIVGVFVRCLLNIFGVMLFLRISWVVGQAGLCLGSVIILLASLVTVLTALSMSAISTNGEVRGGGAYYMISRTLGPEYGGAIGIIFALANAVAVAMYVVGFAETIRDVLQHHDRIMFDESNDVRVIGLITVVILLGVTLAGLSWEAKAQLILLVILILAIANFIIGSFTTPSAEKVAQGFTGYSVKNFNDNFLPDFRDGYQFFTVFAIYFPAATGILAGANISGDLKDAQKAIPKGTLLAILITTIVYLAVAWIAGLCVVRDAPGMIFSPEHGTTNDSDGISYNMASYLPNDTDMWFNSTMGNSTKNVTRTCVPGKPHSCDFGLHNNMQVTQLLSGFAPLTIAGIISATISSALASLVSAPKVFQAVCRDKIFPYIGFFGKGYGKGEEPRRAYVLTFLIGAACICIGDLNSIAPLISNFFLMSYGLINYSCFDASLAKSPGWRPAFKYYSLWFSLAGALLCVVVMFIMSWETALATFALVAGLYLYVHYRKPDINWGSSTQAKVYLDALKSTQKLVMVLEHVKNFRPQVLVLSGYPSHRPAIVDFCSAFTKNVSLMICGHVMVENSSDRVKSIRNWTEMANRWLHRRKSKAFYNILSAKTLRHGVLAMMQSTGLGKLRPNTLMIGFKTNWRTSPHQEIDDYFNIILDAFDLNYSIGILRLREGLDCSHLTRTPVEGTIQDEFGVQQQQQQPQQPPQQPPQTSSSISRLSSWLHLSSTNIGSQRSLDSALDECDSEVDLDIHSDLYLTVDAKQTVNRFHRQRQEGYIDVWWLFDDGGLTVLIPYLLTTKKYWDRCKLRVFTAGTDPTTLNRERRNLATLLHKFRIEYSTTNVISGMDKKPSLESLQEFDRLIEDWVLKRAKGENEETHPWKISEEELHAQREKTCRYIRLREMFRQQSLGASFVFVTLPMPRKGMCSAGLYMAWIDFLTRDMPPILLLRGNQESVLTYYS